jgi:hypothetical protein
VFSGLDIVGVLGRCRGSGRRRPQSGTQLYWQYWQ